MSENQAHGEEAAGLITMIDAAARLDVTVQTVHVLVKRGTLPSVRMYDKTLLPAAAVEEYKIKRRPRPAAGTSHTCRQCSTAQDTCEGQKADHEK